MNLPSRPRRRARDIAKLLQDFGDDQHVLACQLTFLKTIWDNQGEVDKSAFAFLGFKSVQTGKWIDRKLEMRGDHRWSQVSELLERYSRWDYDQYFCPNFFSSSRRLAHFALPTRFAWCDMDESEPRE